jgi:hypothetical protein
LFGRVSETQKWYPLLLETLQEQQDPKKMPSNVTLTGLARDLAARADDGKTIRVGVIGSGEMGTDLVTQGA